MMDKYKKFIYQIEINTIASSMGFFSDSLRDFHKYFSIKNPELFRRYHESYSIENSKENMIIYKGNYCFFSYFISENIKKLLKKYFLYIHYMDSSF